MEGVEEGGLAGAVEAEHADLGGGGEGLKYKSVERGGASQPRMNAPNEGRIEMEAMNGI